MVDKPHKYYGNECFCGRGLRSRPRKLWTLLELACEVVAAHPPLCARINTTASSSVLDHVMAAALGRGVDGAVSVDQLVAKWPWQKMTITRYENLARLYVGPLLFLDSLNEKKRRDSVLMPKIAGTFIDQFYSRPGMILREVDLRGHAMDDETVSWIAKKVETYASMALFYKQGSRQLREAIKALDPTFRDPSQHYLLTLDACLKNEDSLAKLLHAFSEAEKANCALKIRLNSIELHDIKKMHWDTFMQITKWSAKTNVQPCERFCLRRVRMLNAGLLNFVPMLNNFVNLRQLALIDCRLSTFGPGSSGAIILRRLFSRQFTQLVGLDLSGMGLRGSLAVVLDGLIVPLESLCLRGCSLGSDDLNHLKKSKHCATLRELDLSKNFFWDNQIILSTLKLCTNLKVLKLRRMCLHDDKLEKIIEFCLVNLQDIETINIIANWQFTGNSINNLRPFMILHPNLKYIQMSFPMETFSKTLDAKVQYSCQLNRDMTDECQKNNREPVRLIFARSKVY